MEPNAGMVDATLTSLADYDLTLTDKGKLVVRPKPPEELATAIRAQRDLIMACISQAILWAGRLTDLLFAGADQEAAEAWWSMRNALSIPAQRLVARRLPADPDLRRRLREAWDDLVRPLRLDEARRFLAARCTKDLRHWVEIPRLFDAYFAWGGTLISNSCAEPVFLQAADDVGVTVVDAIQDNKARIRLLTGVGLKEDWGIPIDHARTERPYALGIDPPE